MGQGYLSLHVDDADKFVSLPGVKTAMQQAGQGNRIQISQEYQLSYIYRYIYIEYIYILMYI